MKKFIKKEPVLSVAALAALVSCFFVRPGKEYLGYIDISVIILLFSLMLVVAGLIKANLFGVISSGILKASDNCRTVSLLLVNITFITAMFITNDVALITLVPLTAGLMAKNNKKQLIPAVVMETVAANLGSMMTPFGNPQNLYLYKHFNMDPGHFLKVVVPYGIISLVLINVFTFFMIKKENITSVTIEKAEIEDKKLLIIYLAAFVICVLCVLRVINTWICLAVVLAACFVTGYRLLFKVDYFLLLTFCAFFIFVGNLGNIGPVRDTMMDLVGGREFICAAAASQVISNVPAAVMLSGFTENADALVAGTDIGGLGTLVASLASLISYKQYSASEGADMKKYMAVFSVINVVFLAFLCGSYFILN